MNKDTIAAICTPPGKGGVGIVRVSGLLALTSLQRVTSISNLHSNSSRLATLRDDQGNVIDQALVMYFQSPKSFTGEDIVEFHCHGSPVVLDQLLQTLVQLNIRLARPGEFSERAFLNGKIDLAQAEAVADLISSSNLNAAQSALRSLQGVFSTKIQTILNALINLRVFVEAALDFPEEEISVLDKNQIQQQSQNIIVQLQDVLKNAQHGKVLNEGLHILILGEPNVGKSSLFNALMQEDRAIVTHHPGTTRDVLTESINIAGFPIRLVDTAGIRESDNEIEQEGIRRATQLIEQADCIFLVLDINTTHDMPVTINIWLKKYPKINKDKLLVIGNKIDLLPEFENQKKSADVPIIYISAQKKIGLDCIENAIHNMFQVVDETSTFTARRRHLDALTKTVRIFEKGYHYYDNYGLLELLAEDLNQAHRALGEITGEFTSDELLGKIFSEFCIGK
ncbi:MAG: tRNA uridine-5-carboxymethylaminomethyl(34) synthesis GTPase MnmE [Pseudomonadota bacterium]